MIPLYRGDSTARHEQVCITSASCPPTQRSQRESEARCLPRSRGYSSPASRSADGNSQDPRSTTRLKYQLRSQAADKLYRNSRHQPDPRLAGHHRRATNVLDAADNDEWDVGSILPRRSSPRAHSRVDHGLNKTLLFNAAAKHTREAALQLCTVGQCEAKSHTVGAPSPGPPRLFAQRHAYA